MPKISPIIVIPARLGSTRLPNKPLRLINGLPMIVQVIKRVQEADITDILVAAAQKEILDCVQDYGIKGVITDPNLPSGSDRIKQALDIYDPNGKYNIVINVQGDLPTINKSCILDCIYILEDANFDISTLAAEIVEETERTDPNVVKAIISFNNAFNNHQNSIQKDNARNNSIGKALYFTRATSPYGEGPLYHHIGIYGYKRVALNKFTALQPSTLELREKLEQLRALENNMQIGVKVTSVIPLGVDTQEDLEKASRILKDYNPPSHY